MADQVYRVLTVYEADTKRAQQSYSGLIVTLGDLIGLADRAKSMVSHIVALQSSAETSRIAMAGIFSAAGMPGASNFQHSLQMSSEIMAKMRKDARELPGTFEELQGIFQMGILGGGQAGKSINDIEKMSANVMAVSKALNIDSEVAGRELAMMMEGRAGSHNILFQRLRGVMGPGMDAQKFNQMAAPEKWQAIEKSLAKFGPMIAEYSKTWDAAYSTLVDYAHEIERLATTAFFNALKSSVMDLSTWFETNRPQIEAFAKNFGQQLADGFKVIKDVFSYVIAHKEIFLKIAEGFAIGRLTGIGGLGKGGIASSVIGGAAGGAAMAVATNTNANSGWFGEKMEGVRVGLGGLLGAMAPLPGKLGDVASGLSMLYVAMNALAGMLDDWQSRDVVDQGNTDALKDLYFKQNKNVEVAEQTMIRIAHEAGAITAQGTLDPVKFWQYMYKDRGIVYGSDISKMRSRTEEAIEHIGPAEVLRRFEKVVWGPLTKPKDWKDPEKGTADKPTKAVGNMNVAVRIEQNINTEGDPDRLLIATRKAMQEALHRPLLTYRRHVLSP